MSDEIEVCFENKKTGAVFTNPTAVYDTVWHQGLVCQLLQLLPDRHLVKMTAELVYNRSFTFITSGRKSRLRRFKKGGLQGSILAPLLYNVYMHDLPPNTSEALRLCQWPGYSTFICGMDLIGKGTKPWYGNNIILSSYVEIEAQQN